MKKYMFRSIEYLKSSIDGSLVVYDKETAVCNNLKSAYKELDKFNRFYGNNLSDFEFSKNSFYYYIYIKDLDSGKIIKYQKGGF